ncbi:GNAT family N-acetyltransferase [Riemerella columbina]|uniref:GNAT family N-acetyltransferase n=1 Tax=Riemerella columbina TaxID=103810 RepID=UPI00266FD591|nr:GNAT family N-acetyltransferase [Riemerella columbina]WKS94325.1 GNAT family N-acetyltransferase [Riemerella columbina]
MLELKIYRKKELADFVASEAFERLPFSPISYHRAWSHAHNPRAKEDDVVLIVVYIQQQLAGYLGILPDDWCVDGKNYHLGWLSTILIHPDYRGKKIAQALLSKACEVYQGRILMTEFTPEALKLYLKSGRFLLGHQLQGFAFYYYFNFGYFLREHQKIKRFFPLISIVDRGVNAVLKGVYSLFKKKVNYRVSLDIDEEIAPFLEGVSGSDFRKKYEDFEWIIQYPWILKGTKKEMDSRYFFSDYDVTFKTFFLKIYDKNQLKTVILFTERNRILKLQYIFGEVDAMVTEAVYQYMIAHQISNIISFDERINAVLKTKFHLYKKVRTRDFLIHKEFAELLPQNVKWTISGGDADCVFT